MKFELSVVLHFRSSGFNLKNRFGFSSILFIFIMGTLMTAPMIYLDAISSRNSSLANVNFREKLRTESKNYTKLAYLTVRSLYSCQENLKALNLLGRDRSQLTQVSFLPRMRIQNNQLADESLDESVKPWAQNIELSESKLEFVETRSSTTQIYNWKLVYKKRGSAETGSSDTSFFTKEENIPIIVLSDSGGQVIGCEGSKIIGGQLIHDNICKKLNGNLSMYEIMGQKCT